MSLLKPDTTVKQHTAPRVAGQPSSDAKFAPAEPRMTREQLAGLPDGISNRKDFKRATPPEQYRGGSTLGSWQRDVSADWEAYQELQQQKQQQLGGRGGQPPLARGGGLVNSSTAIDTSCAKWFSQQLSPMIVTRRDTIMVDGNQIKLIKLIASGSYGAVLRGVDQRNHPVAVKFMFDRGDDANKNSQTELAMQYWFHCFLDGKRKAGDVPPYCASVGQIHSIHYMPHGQRIRLALLKQVERKERLPYHIEDCVVGIMECLDGDLDHLLARQPTDNEKVPLVSQAIHQVATLLQWVNNSSRSSEHKFSHRDLHGGNVMYKALPDGTLQFYVMDMGMGRGVFDGHNRGRDNGNGIYTNFRNRKFGNDGLDLFMLCVSIAEDFSAPPPGLEQLFMPLKEFFETKARRDGDLIASQFLDRRSPYYLGCHPKNRREPWPLQKNGEDVYLFHHYGYNNAAHNEDINRIFSPENILEKYYNHRTRNPAIRRGGTPWRQGHRKAPTPYPPPGAGNRRPHYHVHRDGAPAGNYRVYVDNEDNRRLGRVGRRY